MKLGLSPLLLLPALAAGCASQPLDSGEASADLTTTRAAYVALKHDLRKCAYPMCGGYWIRDLNTAGPERYVATLDYSRAGLDTRDIAVINEAPIESVVMRGRLGPYIGDWEVRSLIVLDAFVGMPGIQSPGTADQFYVADPIVPPRMCVVAPCNNEVATKVNTGERREFTSYSVKNAAAPFVDLDWLASRVRNHDAVVAAHFENGIHYPGGYETVLTVSQVYVHLPEHAGPCMLHPMLVCPRGQVATFTRDDDRCVRFDECVEPGMCPMYLPVCNPGYTLQAWPAAPAGCNAYACDAFR